MLGLIKSKNQHLPEQHTKHKKSIYFFKIGNFLILNLKAANKLLIFGNA